MTRRAHADRTTALTAIYAKLPTIQCQGLCHDTCGPIQMTPTEHRRIQQRHGVSIPDRTIRDGAATCEALTILKRCGVYPDRPLLCRLWGLLTIMPCTYGCKPDRYLSATEGYELLAQAYQIDGDHQRAAQFRAIAPPTLNPTQTAQLTTALRAFIGGQATAADTETRVRQVHDG